MLHSTATSPLPRLREICLALPEAAAEAHGAHCRFLVRGRTFAWFTEDHHGDGRVALSCKAAPGVQGTLTGSDPVRFFIPPYLGAKGWIGIYLDVDGTGWDEIEDLVSESYRLVAPRGLAGRLRTGRLQGPDESVAGQSRWSGAD